MIAAEASYMETFFIPGMYSLPSSTSLVIRELESALGAKIRPVWYDEFLKQAIGRCLSLEENLKWNIFRQYEAVCGKDAPVVIGHSFGGLIGILLASRYPVSRLILTAPAIAIINIRQLLAAYVEKKARRLDVDMVDTDITQFEARKEQFFQDMKPYGVHFKLFSDMSRLALSQEGAWSAPH
jgi:hypothetical protein